MRPSITQLEYLVALARTLNFRQAAEQLHVSQPALSTQIKKLETQLGVTLFERDRRRVLPTEIGTEVVRQSQRILRDLDEMAAYVRSRDDPMAGTVRLGVIPTIAPFALPRALPEIHRRYPDLRLYVREEQTSALLDRLRDGRLDLVLLAIDVDVGSAETLALFDDAFVLAMPPSHRLASRDQITIADLRDEEVLLLEDGHCLAQQSREVCRQAGSHELGDFRATSLGTLVQMVAAGLGITLLPEMAVPELRRHEGLVMRPFAEPRPSRKVGLAWRHGALRADTFRALGELFERAV